MNNHSYSFPLLLFHDERQALLQDDHIQQAHYDIVEQCGQDDAHEQQQVDIREGKRCIVGDAHDGCCTEHEGQGVLEHVEQSQMEQSVGKGLPGSEPADIKQAVGHHHHGDALLIEQEDDHQLQAYLSDVQPHVDIAAPMTDDQVLVERV